MTQEQVAQVHAVQGLYKAVQAMKESGMTIDEIRDMVEKLLKGASA